MTHTKTLTVEHEGRYHATHKQMLGALKDALGDDTKLAGSPTFRETENRGGYHSTVVASYELADEQAPAAADESKAKSRKAN